MLTIDVYSRIVHTIYATTVGDSPWDAALEQIATAIGAGGCALVVTEPENKAIAHRSTGADPECVVTYNQHYCELDPTAAAIAQVPAGQVISLQQLHNSDTIRNSEFFNDWATPNGHGDGTYSLLTRHGERSSWLCATAEPGSVPFSSPQRMRVLATLVPHLQQAIALHTRLSEIDRRSADFVAGLEAASEAMAIIGANGRVTYLNPVAAAVLSGGDGLQLSTEGLRASVPAFDSALAHTVRTALGRDGVPTAGRVLVPRPSGKRPYVVRVVPVSTAGAPTALVVVDPDHRALPAVETLIRDYGLTRTEGEVARKMLEGARLQSIADERSVSITTVRTHVKHIFEKTGTHRQAELVRLLLGASTTS